MGKIIKEIKKSVILTSSVHHNSAQDTIIAALDCRIVIISAVHCHRVGYALPVVLVRIVGIHIRQPSST